MARGKSKIKVVNVGTTKKKKADNTNVVSSNDAKLAAAEENYENFQKLLQSKNVWNHDKPGLIAVKASMQMLSLKTGIYARVPIYCKGDKCPYSNNCPIFINGLAPEGEACPVEVAQIERKFAMYAKDFELDGPDASPTDLALVEEVITMEIYMERCKSLMSTEISPIQMVAVGVTEDGAPVEQPQVSKAVEAYNMFSKKRNADFDLLMATRKNKKKDDKDEDRADLFSIIEKAQQMPDFYTVEQKPDNIDANGNIVDAETEDKK